MYIIKDEICEELLKISGEGYPKREIIEEYKNGCRMAQENTVRAFASLLKIEDWKELVVL